MNNSSTAAKCLNHNGAIMTTGPGTQKNCKKIPICQEGQTKGFFRVFKHVHTLPQIWTTGNSVFTTSNNLHLFGIFLSLMTVFSWFFLKFPVIRYN